MCIKIFPNQSVTAHSKTRIIGCRRVCHNEKENPSANLYKVTFLRPRLFSQYAITHNKIFKCNSLPNYLKNAKKKITFYREECPMLKLDWMDNNKFEK